ncbi:Transposon TX1 uncharacterized 149 kDa protein [Frankliniella fusca]|uniref:Transposon TX1 uncharacterized 149 kDa protein n=1 Tax=Frankliniella fusca TaxID=407009 RepID=A0AAE1LGU9_9NEOP|nr:Transposon TX1 uncharacterized 149 kDa protein [Frankliniella fusca]
MAQLVPRHVASLPSGQLFVDINLTPPGRDSLFRSAAAILHPDDAAAVPFRAQQLRLALEERAGRSLTPPEALQGLADLLARDVLVYSPQGACLTSPRGGPPPGRAQPLRLYDAGPTHRPHYDVVTKCRPLLPTPPGPLPPPPSPPPAHGVVPLEAAGSQASLRSATSAPDALTPRPPRARGASPPPPADKLTVCTWNVRGAARPDARSAVDSELWAQGAQIAVLQETRLCQQELVTEHYHWYVGGTPHRGGRGLALLVARHHPGVALRSHAFLHPDVVVAEVRLFGVPFTIVGVHLPTDGAPTQRVALDVAAAALATAQPEQFKILLGDCNAHIGRGEVGGVVGPALHHDHTNLAGAGLPALARLHRLSILTTQVRARGCAFTWRRGGAGEDLAVPTSQLDHVATTYPRARCVTAFFSQLHRSDHKLLVAALGPPPPLPFTAGRRADPGPPRPGDGAAPRRQAQEWATAALNAEAMLQERYAAALDAALLQLAARGHELTWRQLVGAMVTAANATLRVAASPMTPRRLAAVHERRRLAGLRARAPGDPHAVFLWQEAERALLWANRAHREEKVAAQLAAIQGVRPAQRLHTLFRFLRRHRRAAAARGAGPTLRQWEDAVREQAEGAHPPLLVEEPDPQDFAPTAAQLQGCASRLSRNTAPGPDDLPAELLIHATPAFFEHLAGLVGAHWRRCAFPPEWTTSCQHPIPKVPRPEEVGDYRTISLCAALYKALSLHLLDHLTALTPPLPYYQAGFQAQRSTYGHIFIVRRILDEYWRAGVPVHLLGLDIKAAFPSVSKASVVEALGAAGVPPSLSNRVIALALTDRTFIRWGGAATPTVVRGRGVRQGCGVSPFLFLLVLHGVVRRAVAPLPRFDLDFRAPGLLPVLCAYADDVLVVADGERDLADFLAAFVAGLREVGLQLNPRKCEYLVRQPAIDPLPLPRPVRMAGLEIQRVAGIIYLGAHITNALDRQPVVYHRIRRSQRSLAALLPAIRERGLPLPVLDRLHTSIIRPSLEYELALASSTQRSRASLRRQDGVIREALRATALRVRPGRLPPPPPGPVRSASRGLRIARVAWRGHIERRPAGHPLRRALAFTLGRKKVGRPCFTFNTTLAEDMARYPPPPQGWPALFQDKAALARYLRDTPTLVVSSDEEEEADDAPAELGGPHPSSEEEEVDSPDEL